jgi:hypothetical protein
MTTRTDQELDTGTVDMGHHYERVCTDADEDGYSIEGGGCGELDCDDLDPNANPGMEEIPRNGTDDDCDPFTPDAQPWSVATPAEASSLGIGSGAGSAALNVMATILIPMAIVFALRIVRGRIQAMKPVPRESGMCFDDRTDCVEGLSVLSEIAIFLENGWPSAFVSRRRNDQWNGSRKAQ